MKDTVRDLSDVDCLVPGPDYSDYDEELAAEIDSRIENDDWLSNRRQPYVVVETVGRTLAMDSSRKAWKRRHDAQEELLDELPVNDMQSIQDHCQRRLFEGYEQPPEDIRAKKLWHQLFDALIREIERETRSTPPQ